MPSIEKLDEVTELIKYVVYSDYLELDEKKKEVALSALIIARIESGKTSVVERFSKNDGILRVGDITAYGLETVYIEEIKSGSVKRIIIPDLINPVNRKQETVNSLITFFNSYISWEGVGSIATYALQLKLDTPLKGSILTTIAIQDYIKMESRLAAVGFISRLIPITYNYTQRAVEEILLDIADGKDDWKDLLLKFPDGKVNVELPAELARQLIPASEHIAKYSGAYGMRALKQLMTLVRCKALSEDRMVVTQEDVDRVIYLAGRFIKIPDECVR